MTSKSDIKQHHFHFTSNGERPWTVVHHFMAFSLRLQRFYWNISRLVMQYNLPHLTMMYPEVEDVKIVFLASEEGPLVVPPLQFANFIWFQKSGKFSAFREVLWDPPREWEWIYVLITFSEYKANRRVGGAHAGNTNQQVIFTISSFMKTKDNQNLLCSFFLHTSASFPFWLFFNCQ